MAIVLFDRELEKDLSPLTQLHAVADIRMGILTFKERWAHFSQEKVLIYPRKYLSSLYESLDSGFFLWIQASLFPDKELFEKILNLKKGEALADEKGLIAGRPLDAIKEIDLSSFSQYFKKIYHCTGIKKIQFPWDMIKDNEAMIKFDISLIQKNKKNVSTDDFPGSQFISSQQIFIAKGAQINCSILDASDGPIFLDEQSKIMSGSLIRGPFALGKNSVIKMGAKIYGGTTLGPSCVGGGEIKNSIFQGYSNKAHDGYLGDSYIGNWCNLGAGTSVSNVKNTGNNIIIKTHDVGQKLGVIMGDYGRTAINTSINTGTVSGICSNIFGTGLSPKEIPDFSWGYDFNEKYAFEKALIHIEKWKSFKNETLTDAEKKVLKYIFAQIK
ncbi:MAG: glucose-1-phosphate thymidylyltransferase [Bacteroidetes bacterium]|nr:glucose-1-phosphate thymidylyltransferase [Bacteroidota bacterium]